MILNTVLALTWFTIVSINAQCACNNNGQCQADDSCVCQPGYYGLTCSLLADTYQVEYISTPEKLLDVITKLNGALQNLSVYDIQRISPGNLLKLSFKRKLSAEDKATVKQLAFTAAQSAVSSVTDYDECVNGQLCYNGVDCVNTEGSFKCGCAKDDIVENGKCVNIVDNTRLTIYIWSAAVAAILVLMIGVLIFYQRRKTLKGKMIQKEAQKRAAIRKTAMSPTNMNYFDQRITPEGSVVGYENQARPFSLQPDAASLYSYSSRQAMSERGYPQNRLSVPVLDNYPEVENNSPKPDDSTFYDQPYPNSFPANLGQLGSSNQGYVPTEFGSSAQDVNEDNEENEYNKMNEPEHPNETV